MMVGSRGCIRVCASEKGKPVVRGGAKPRDLLEGWEVAGLLNSNSGRVTKLRTQKEEREQMRPDSSTQREGAAQQRSRPRRKERSIMWAYYVKVFRHLHRQRSPSWACWVEPTSLPNRMLRLQEQTDS
jgi:hypothetical protein